ncbi:hypothetical protein BTO30_08765 [Domibacillus antri]|uniref:Uncharacterized protein n=1 Tax=Domibacillus antri TaxID=1714264 RepID=A0A1Q8Q5E0_9BACI|nr:hypothetical protein [Domibacillus antri]OLN22570.1 hypothetical protein BTO30_08765 [Domibacillus antri]
MVSSPHLYEVWILFQLIHQLKKAQFTCENITGSMIAHFEKERTLSGWSGKFKSSKGAAGLYYEKEIDLENGRKVKPDFIFLFKNSNQNWDAHVLDAKYKPYTNINENVLQNDLEHSARRYLEIKHEKITVKSAALVHIDEKTNNWNVDANHLYKISQFPTLPGLTDHLATYMKRIFHHFNNWLSMCPKCGGDAECILGNYKVTYICDRCENVWVKNQCRGDFHPNSTTPRLLKYPSGNYNIQVGNQWNVYCPVCFRDVNGNRIRQNLYGHCL